LGRLETKSVTGMKVKAVTMALRMRAWTRQIEGGGAPSS
jgi:hypothetical protein